MVGTTFEEIEAFLAVVKTGSLSAAAKALYVAQPTLSRRIDSLESELGSRLLVRGRGKRATTLTETGRAMVPVAQKWARLWGETSDVVRRGGADTFAVGVFQTLCAYVMPDALARFHARQVPRRIKVDVLHSLESYDAVEGGSIDVAFVGNTRHSELLSATPVFSEPLVLVCSPMSPYRDGVHPSELDGNKALFVNVCHEYQMWHDYWFGANSQAVVADTFSLVETMLQTPGLWAVAPLSAARSCAATKGLRCVRMNEAPPDRTVHMLTRGPAGPLAEMLAEDIRVTVAETNGEEARAHRARAGIGHTTERTPHP